jgi:hypothetical protein
MLSIRYRPPFWNITRNNGTLHEIKGLQGVLGCFAKTKKNIIMLSMTYKNKNDYITKPVILGITQSGLRATLLRELASGLAYFVTLRYSENNTLRFAALRRFRYGSPRCFENWHQPFVGHKKTPRPEGRGVRWII